MSLQEPQDSRSESGKSSDLSQSEGVYSESHCGFAVNKHTGHDRCENRWDATGRVVVDDSPRGGSPSDFAGVSSEWNTQCSPRREGITAFEQAKSTAFVWNTYTDEPVIDIPLTDANTHPAVFPFPGGFLVRRGSCP